MESFICPVCRQKLSQKDKSLICENNHLYDISKYGYVNLLMSQTSKGARHGDSKEMIEHRRDFLDLGHYAKLRDFLCELSAQYASDGMKVLDIGCGECYYTSALGASLKEHNPKMIGIDISKNALIYGFKRDKSIELAVASAYDLPIEDNSIDLAVNLFAPHSDSELLRVIKPGGILIRVFPSSNHLWELKEAIYETPVKNEAGSIQIEGFKPLNLYGIRYNITLKSNNEIKSLFGMTPYSYKTSAEDEKKLDSINELTTRVEFTVLIYKKI